MKNKFCENAGPLMALSKAVGKVEKGLQNLETHFTNHLSDHRLDRIFMLIQTLIIIGLFCFLKWS